MALITYFKASLRCLRCHKESTAWIHSHLGGDGRTYQIGDDVSDDIDPVQFDDTSYLVRPPLPNEATHVLLSWNCDHCNSSDFVEVVIADGRVSNIQVVELTPKTLERLHYVADDVQSMIEDIVGTPVYDQNGVRADWLQLLQSALEAGNRWVPSPTVSGS